MPQTAYGDISPRNAAYAAKDLLKRGIPYLVLEKFGQPKPVPTKSSKVVKFRRYNALANASTPLTEGVTPSAKKLTATDVTATLNQYGDIVTITDVVMDTHEDPVLQEAIEVLGEQAAQTIEEMRFNILKAGTNVLYANSVAGRANVVAVISLADQRRATRTLKRQNARRITSVVRSTPNYGTESVAPSFIGLVHPDLEGDIRNLPGFVPTEKYGQMSPFESEIGKVEDVRYISSTVFEPWADAGGVAGSMLSTGGANADVYPVLYIGANAYGIVPLKGKNAITPSVINPNKPSSADPLGQRGFAGWKCYQTAVILNDMWMAVGKVAVTAL